MLGGSTRGGGRSRRAERTDPADDTRLRRVFLRWTLLGWTATAILFYGLWTMVTGRML